MRAFSILAFSALVASVSAKIVVITVGNTTADATTVFQPPTVTADEGDIVRFNFTHGNHTATQSTFAFPCIPAHFTNQTINSFDSSFRNAGNESAITTLDVSIMDNTTTIWFFDWNTCAEGGVGGINLNTSSLETLDGLQRNAIRLNGTNETSTSSSASSTGSRTSTSATSTSTSSSSDATRTIALGGAAILPLLLAAMFL